MDKKYKILLVDDDKFLLEMYKKKFEQSGAEVDLALGSEQTLTKLRDGAKPDIVVLDVIMPGMDGMELLEVIHKEKLLPDTIIIMLTNESDEEKVEEAKNLGINGYIVKAAKVPTEVVEQVWKIAEINKK
jgi:CheY-like chemotaxis protein